MNIYIGNLNYRVRESDLQQVLEEYGTVESVKLIIDRDTRRSKGFAFAELPNENEARKTHKKDFSLRTSLITIKSLKKRLQYNNM